ncbi:MAG: hypothetical protein CFE34_13895 [Rhodobacteraceae bacterium PARR1]|nr:MAG: hypothetical protein CFE34_13895 [Rhodobacteraceae bacterium PARR1]
MVMLRTRYRILVLDPSPGLAAALAALLGGNDGFLAEGRAVDARMESLPKRFSAEIDTEKPAQPDAVMLDPSAFTLAPDGLIQRLHDCYGPIRLLGYASGDSPGLVRTCLGLGFRAFLAKSATLETIRMCLSAVKTGGVFIDAPHSGALLTTPDSAPPAPTRSLTEREAYVLKSVARGKSLKEIGYELSLSSKTVETYKARGTSKLNISGRREIVEYAIRAGWV